MASSIGGGGSTPSWIPADLNELPSDYRKLVSYPAISILNSNHRITQVYADKMMLDFQQRSSSELDEYKTMKNNGQITAEEYQEIQSKISDLGSVLFTRLNEKAIPDPPTPPPLPSKPPPLPIFRVEEEDKITPFSNKDFSISEPPEVEKKSPFGKWQEPPAPPPADDRTVVGKVFDAVDFFGIGGFFGRKPPPT